MSPTTSAQISTETTPEAIAAGTEPGTEYGDKRAELAPLLYELHTGRGAWEHLDEGTRAHYVADADAVLQSLPHLLSYGARERLAPLLPTVAL